jgi:hypothetical protein
VLELEPSTWESRSVALQIGDGPDQTLARAHGKAESFQIDLGQISQVVDFDLLVFDYLGY